MYKEKIIENIKLLSQQDIDFLSKINPRLVGFIHSKDGVIDFIPENSWRIEWEYLNGYLGQSFRSKLRTAKNYFTEPDRLLKTSSMMMTEERVQEPEGYLSFSKKQLKITPQLR